MAPKSAQDLAQEAPLLSAGKEVAPTTSERIKLAFSQTIRSRYFYASVVYVAYTYPMYFNVDFSSEKNNRVYLEFAIVHVVNAFMYAYAWDDKKWNDVELVPEYLNIIEASLYLWSATLYPKIYTSDDDNAGYAAAFYTSRKLELAASAIDVVASFGWVYTWWLGYQKYRALPEPTSGRGWTIEDPDLHANWTILAASIIYLVYELHVYLKPSAYATNYLYEIADLLYFCNSVLYLLAALREYGWFWFLPSMPRWFRFAGSQLAPPGASDYQVIDSA